MQRKESLIEVKVGALVLGAIAVLATLVMILGDFNFNKGFTFYVDFSNAAGLKPGAPVRIAGIPAGTVQSVEFEGGAIDPDTGDPVFVRATLWLEESARESVRQDATFVITTQSVLGEPYVEIHTEDLSMPAIEEGQKFRGDDPPRLDMLMSSAYDSLEGLRELTERLNESERDDAIRIDEFINNIGSLAGHVDERVVANEEEIDSIVEHLDGVLTQADESIEPIFDNVENATAEFAELGASLNHGMGRGQSLRQILDNTASITRSVEAHAEPTMQGARDTLETSGRLLTENEESINTTIDNVETISENFAGASDEVAAMVDSIAAGENSIGMLLQDEEIFDDMREFVRELKRRPWRIIWKE